MDMHAVVLTTLVITSPRLTSELICQGKEIIPGSSSRKQALVKMHAIRSAGRKPSTADLRPQCPMLTMFLIDLGSHAPSEQQRFVNS
jgi:hypothetical protein